MIVEGMKIKALSLGIGIALSPDGFNLSLTGLQDDPAHSEFVNQLREHKPTFVIDLRLNDARARIASWMAFCNAERGYDWTMHDWRMSVLHKRLQNVIIRYAGNEATLDELHASFVRFASLHRTIKETILNRQAVDCPVPQRGHFEEEGAERQFARFGLNLDDAAALYCGGESG